MARPRVGSRVHRTLAGPAHATACDGNVAEELRLGVGVRAAMCPSGEGPRSRNPQTSGDLAMSLQAKQIRSNCREIGQGALASQLWECTLSGVESPCPRGRMLGVQRRSFGQSSPRNSGGSACKRIPPGKCPPCFVFFTSPWFLWGCCRLWVVSRR